MPRPIITQIKQEGIVEIFDFANLWRPDFSKSQINDDIKYPMGRETARVIIAYNRELLNASGMEVVE